ncbi:hypothetical protein BC941DRAFT_511541 [Chlamydoabsidia padenii]|nr:hypothetical protein BC941DRAFT_511541 [Chlamydoabsidia padenii]
MQNVYNMVLAWWSCLVMELGLSNSTQYLVVENIGNATYLIISLKELAWFSSFGVNALEEFTKSTRVPLSLSLSRANMIPLYAPHPHESVTTGFIFFGILYLFWSMVPSITFSNCTYWHHVIKLLNGMATWCLENINCSSACNFNDLTLAKGTRKSISDISRN